MHVGKWKENTDLKPFDNLFDVLVVNETLHWHTFTSLVEDFEAGVGWGPPNHISAGTVENHALRFLFDEDDELIGDPE